MVSIAGLTTYAFTSESVFCVPSSRKLLFCERPPLTLMLESCPGRMNKVDEPDCGPPLPITTPPVQRQIQHTIVLDHLAKRGTLGVEQRGVAGHLHMLGRSTRLERDVD